MNKQKAIIFLNIIIGFLFIVYIIYHRVLRIRLPKELWILTHINFGEIRYNIIITVFLGILFSAIVIYQSLRTIFFQEKQTIFTRVSAKITEFLDNALWELYNFIAQYIPNGYYYISTFCYYFYETFSKKSETLFLFILYAIRCIILFCFLIDVIFFFKLDYMYKALYLLCITLLIKFIFYILKDFAKNLNEAESYLIITSKGVDSDTLEPITNYALKSEFQDLNLFYHVGQYILCCKISGYLEIYERYYKFFSPYFNLVLYSCYFVSWIYILCLNFFYCYV